MPRHGPQRKLTAILAADVVGYSRLMGADEAGTLLRLKHHLETLIEPVVTEHGGRIVKLMGDGLLAEFPSVVEAVSCAVDIQQKLAASEVARPENERMLLRIGVNLGDVMSEGTDIHGDGVNIAARLQQLAEPGGICISESSYQQVKGKLSIPLVARGRQRMKNIAEPIEVWRVAVNGGMTMRNPRTARRLSLRIASAVAVAILIAGGGAALLWQQVVDATPKVATRDVLAVPTGPSLGVLPFANKSGDPAQDAFADGLTEEIIADLTRFRELHVIARNKVFRDQGQAVDLLQLGRDLGLSYALDGSVRLAPETVRITARLIDVRDARQVWSETYDRPLTPESIVAVQDEVADKIAAAIASSSGGAIVAIQQQASLSKAPQELSSYECVVSAMAWIRYDEGLYPKISQCLRETVRREPEYADAWAMIAVVYAEQWYGYEPRYTDEVYDPLERCLEAGRRAVGLAPNSARAHFALAKAYLMEGNLEGFYAEAQQTLRLNPNEPAYFGSLGNWIAFTGRWDEGLALVAKARALNPGAAAPGWYYSSAINHYRRDEYEAALHDFQRAFTGWWANYMQQAYTYGMLGDAEQSKEVLEKLLQKRPGFSIAHAVEFHRKYHFEPEVIDKIVEGLRRAGLAEGELSEL